MGRGAITTVTVVLAAALLTGCSATEVPPPVTTTPSPTRTSTAPAPAPASTPAPTPTPTPAQKQTFVTLDCAGAKVQVQRETADFTQAWARSDGSRCETPYTNGSRPTVTPVTDLEKAAYAASGYTRNDVATLYGMCAAVNPGDLYLNGTYVMNAAQAAELRGALTLCPTHPLAAQYLEAIDKATNPARQDEKPVSSGNYVVGTDLAAGTYKTTDTEWDACYWARVKGDGTIIENNLVTFAPDGVTVTVHNGEGFQSEGCGTWRKVG